MLLNELLYTVGYDRQYVDICHVDEPNTTIFYGKVKDARINKVVEGYNFRQVKYIFIYDDDVKPNRRVLMIALA